MGANHPHQNTDAEPVMTPARSKQVRDSLQRPTRRIRRSLDAKPPVLAPPDSVIEKTHRPDKEEAATVTPEPQPSVPAEHEEEKLVVLPERSANTSDPSSVIVLEKEQEQDIPVGEEGVHSFDVVIPDFDDSFIEKTGTRLEGLTKPISVRLYEETEEVWDQLVEKIQHMNPQIKPSRVARVAVLVWLRLDPLIRKLVSVLGRHLEKEDYIETELLSHLARLYNLNHVLPKNTRRFTSKGASVGLTDSETEQLDELHRWANQSCPYMPSPRKQLIKTSQIRMAIWIISNVSIDWVKATNWKDRKIENSYLLREEFEEKASQMIITQLNRRVTMR